MEQHVGLLCCFHANSYLIFVGQFSVNLNFSLQCVFERLELSCRMMTLHMHLPRQSYCVQHASPPYCWLRWALTVICSSWAVSASASVFPYIVDTHSEYSASRSLVTSTTRSQYCWYLPIKLPKLLYVNLEKLVCPQSLGYSSIAKEPNVANATTTSAASYYYYSIDFHQLFELT